jgi:hypothetical protein
LVAFVDPRYRVSGVDGCISWLEVEIFYSHRPLLGSSRLVHHVLVLWVCLGNRHEHQQGQKRKSD